MRISLTALTIIMLAACGQKGDLYKPEPKSPLSEYIHANLSR